MTARAGAETPPRGDCSTDGDLGDYFRIHDVCSHSAGFFTYNVFFSASLKPVFPGVILYLKNWLPAAARAKTVSLFMTAGPIARVLGGTISGALMGMSNSGHLAGWQWVFLMEGVRAILLGGVAFCFLVDHPNDARWLSPDERTWLMQTLKREKANTSKLSTNGLVSAFANPNIWLLRSYISG